MFQGEWHILRDCFRPMGTISIAAAGKPYSSFCLVWNVQCSMFQGEWYIMLNCSGQIGTIPAVAEGKFYPKFTA